jgi:hypothetical protein
MKELDEGHYYELDSLDGESGIQRLQFVKREGLKYPGNVGHNPGTNCQEVTRTLVARSIYINKQIPCWQTWLSKYLYAGAIWLYEHRAAKRHRRKAPRFWEAVYGATCKNCGHVGCDGLHHK